MLGERIVLAGNTLSLARGDGSASMLLCIKPLTLAWVCAEGGEEVEAWRTGQLARRRGKEADEMVGFF